jgi:hypothetical protein
MKPLENVTVHFIRVNNVSSLTRGYLLTPWSRVLLEKLTVNFVASQEIPRIYGTRKFLTVPTRARHLSIRLRDTSSRNTPPPEIRMRE